MTESVISLRGKNVLGTALHPCCTSPKTGFFRDGFCRTNEMDRGKHTVCAIVTDEFLEFSASRGNDLRTPSPENDFPGLKSGDRWCLCVERWKEAFLNNVAPPVILESTDESALDGVSLADLQRSSYQ